MLSAVTAGGPLGPMDCLHPSRQRSLTCPTSCNGSVLGQGNWRAKRDEVKSLVPLMHLGKSLQYTLSRVVEAEMIRNPFRHLIIPRMFDAEFYGDLLNHLPPEEVFLQYRNIDLGISQSRCIVDAGKLESTFWNEFAAAFGSRGFTESVLRKFGTRYRDDFYVTTQLIRDSLGYSIGPHTDIISKTLSILFYLPRDDSCMRYGTSICKALDPALTGSQDHHSWHQFEETHRALFRPNTALAFCRSDDSFHAVRAIDTDIVRHSIAVTLRCR
jgi:hypothetical protein